MQKTSEQEIKENSKVMKKLGGNDMFKQMKKRVKNEKGLTLIELLAVIVILAVIAAIAVPSIANIIDNSKDKAVLSETLSVIAAAKLADANGECGTTHECTAATITKYLDGETTGLDAKKTSAGWEISALSGTLTTSSSYTPSGPTAVTSGYYTEASIINALE